MKINSIPSVRFSSIYAISAKPDIMKKISKKCDAYSSNYLQFKPATGIYKNDNKDGFCHSAVRQGREVAFLVVGKEDCSKVRFMDSGYTTLNGISQHLDGGYRIDNISYGKGLVDGLMADEVPECHQDCVDCYCG